MEISDTTTVVPVRDEVFTTQEQLALGGFLAGYSRLTREAYALDLRQYIAWCTEHAVPLFGARRSDIECFSRHLEAVGRARATIARRYRQQLLEAIGRPSDLRDDLTTPTLDTLRWAFPHRLTQCRWPDGSTLAITITGPEHDDNWSLRSDGSSWAFDPVADGVVVGQMVLTTEQAWRLLTNNYRAYEHGSIQVLGDPKLIDVLTNPDSLREMVSGPRCVSGRVSSPISVFGGCWAAFRG